MVLPNRSVGFIVFRRLNSQIQFLLLKASNGGHWSPPKGHVEPGEDDLMTAYRETQEEVGYDKSDIKIVPDFRKELTYIAWNLPKVTVLYLAELLDPERAVSVSDEHTEYQWQCVDEACRLAGFADLQAVLREADSFVRANTRSQSEDVAKA